MSKDRRNYISALEDFKELLLNWDYGHQPQYRTEINKRIKNVKTIVQQAGAFKVYTISPPPAIGGLILKNVDPFLSIFESPYGMNMIPPLIDSIDEAIGAIESKADFTLINQETKPNKKSPTNSNRVFIVHGRDNELKETTARFLERLGLSPIILHEQINQGRTIIEKFEDYSDVSFAVILMTPDDIGTLATKEEKLNKRARQNVVFELGYFIGKLGRKKVAALVKGEIEIPSDYHGVTYIGIDNNDGWKMFLAKEIKASGLNIDLNKIF